MIEIGIFLAGFAIIAFGANKFSKEAITLAHIFKLPKIFIGATIVSLVTTAPETAVSILSSVQKHSGIALGNALGSPIANIGLILSLVLLFGKVNFEKNIFKATVALVTLSLVSFMIVLFQRTITSIGGILLIFLGLFYLWYLAKTSEIQNNKLENLDVVNVFRGIIQIVKSFFKLIFGLILILFGGYLIILEATHLAKILSVSEIFIGLTFISLGTSLPELALAVLSIFTRSVTISVGNLIGASVLTLTLTLGIAGTISPVTTTPSVFFFDFPAILFLSISFLAGQYFKISAKILGAFFLIFYIFYLVTVKIVG